MDFQRSRNRRRRVLRDDVNSNDSQYLDDQEDNSSDDSGTRSSRNYTSGARKKHQLRTTDLVPKRILSFSIVALFLIFVSTGLSLLHVYSANWNQLGDLQDIFSATNSQGLISWFCNLLLILGAAGCLQIYALRRHRCDDYRASYRLWGWLALAFCLASACCVTRLDIFAGWVVREFTGWSFLQDGSVFWLIFKFTILSLVSVRVLYETWQSRGATIVLGFSAMVLATTLLLNNNWFANQFIGPFHLVFQTATLWALATMSLGLLIFSRFVYLDAHSLIKHKEKVASESRWSGIRIPQSLKMSSLPKLKFPSVRLPSMSFPSIKIPSLPKMRLASSSVSSQNDDQSSESANSAKKKSDSKVSTKLQSRKNKSSKVKSRTDSNKDTNDNYSTSKNSKRRSSSNSHNGNSSSRSSSGRSSLSAASTSSSHDESNNPNILKLSGADQRLLETEDSDIELLSKSDRRRLKKLQKRVRQAA